LSVDLKRDLILAVLATILIIVMGIGASHIAGVVMAPEQAKLAPKQVEDDAGAYQVVRDANIGVVRTWLWTLLALLILFIWAAVLLRHWARKKQTGVRPC